MSSIRETKENLIDMFSNTLSQEKFDNRQMLLKILENVQFFGRQGLPLTGNENDGNFDQLLLHTAKSDSRVTEWLKKKKKENTRIRTYKTSFENHGIVNIERHMT